MSACVSIENFNAELGNKYSREKALDKVWGYLGYDLATKVNQIKKAGSPSGKICNLGTPTTYVGSKVIHAIPMNRLEYNNLRGWELPKDEDGTDEGYLVQYTDGGVANVEGFTGYISWSPRDVFEVAYNSGVAKAPETYLDRLTKEVEELSIKQNKLHTFIHGDVFLTLSEEDQEDLTNQNNAMKLYLGILKRRIARTTV